MNHAERYQVLLTQIEHKEDPSYLAAIYLLSADKDLHQVCNTYVESDGIDFDAIKACTQGFDERTRFVIDIAHNLFSWTSECRATPFEISRLGYPYTEMVYQAMQIANEQLRIDAVTRGGKPSLFFDDSKYQQAINIATAFGMEPLVSVPIPPVHKQANKQPSLAEFIAEEAKKLSVSERLETAKQQVAIHNADTIPPPHDMGHKR